MVCYQNELVKIIKIIKNKGKEIALRIDALILENDLQALEKYLIFTSSLDIDYYIFSDLSIYFYLKKYNISTKYIYNAKTINCSLNEALYYQSLGIDVILSQELPLIDITNITNVVKTGIEGYGHPLIFYSRRRLLTNYKQKYDLMQKLSKNIYLIQEKTTKILLYLIEDEKGTLIYHYERYHLYHELSTFNNIKYFFINPHFINEKDLIKVLKIYTQALNNKINNDDYETLLSLYPKTTSGFLYQKPQILEVGQNEKN